MRKIFICFPLRHDDPSIMEDRIKKAKEYCVKIFKLGNIPFSPGLAGIDMMKDVPEHGLDISFRTWQKFCYSYLEVCDEVHLLQMDGWDKSEGIKGELIEAYKQKKEVFTIKI